MGRNGDTIEFEKVCAKRTDKGLDLYDDKDFAHLPQVNEKKIKKKQGNAHEAVVWSRPLV